MGKRREARERAVQFLFQHDLNPPEDLPAALEQFWESQRAGGHRRGEGRGHLGRAGGTAPAHRRGSRRAALCRPADPRARWSIATRRTR